MTPEEAISVNTKLAKELDVPQRARERKAVQLGIEALKKIALLSPKGEKPPIMYEDAIRELKVDNVPSYVPSLMRFQRDADAAYYEPLIQQSRQEGRDDVLAILENDYPEEAQSIKQALKGSKEKMK